MKRLLVVVIGLSLTSTIIVIRWGLIGTDRFAFAQDIEAGLGYLRIIRQAELRCYESAKHYVPIDHLGITGCGGLDERTLEQPHNGFVMEGFGKDSEFGIFLSPDPMSPTREISLYADQRGSIRWAAGRKATSSSQVLIVDRLASVVQP